MRTSLDGAKEDDARRVVIGWRVVISISGWHLAAAGGVSTKKLAHMTRQQTTGVKG
jgi:hypothetical protein